MLRAPMRVRRSPEVRKPAEPPPARATTAAPKPARADGFNPKASHATAADLKEQLDAATKIRRAPGPAGSEQLLTPREEARVRQAFAKLPAATARELSGLLAAQKSDAAGVARALLFKAISARADALPGEKPMQVLRDFSALVATLPQEQLLERASVLDLDWTKNSNTFDPQALWERRGVIAAHGDGDTQADNDGLIQRFTASCGPTTLQMLLAEADPVLAFAINQDGRASLKTDGPTAKFQRSVLEEFGGIALGRASAQLSSRVKNALAHLVTTGDVTPKQRDAALELIKGGVENAAADKAIGALRTTYGFPSDAEVKQLRTALLPARDEGIGYDGFTASLDKYARSVVGAGFKQTEPVEGFGRGQAGRYLDDVAKALAKGFDVPIGVSEPAHWMLITAVKGKGTDREFLVSDPDGGKSAWVTTKDLVSGTFGDKQFHLPSPGERPYIDSFFLPG
jgi:hypothetical protein